ncbi:MAG TPA: glycosyltransferase family 4 protein [Hanamia sp.]|nr:glycosyltransferase family 4 protein [Hanamia sp.]
MTYRSAILKRNIEAIFRYPFVLMGKILSPFFRLKTQHKIFIFCPSGDIGGSIQNNADLCSCFVDKSPLVIFSKKPRNNEFLHLFNIEGVSKIDLHRYIDNKWYHFVNFFYRGIVSSWINQVEDPVVFGGESLFFYKVLPYIKKETRCVDLCHLNTWFNYTQAFVKDIDARIFSTGNLKREAEALYKKNNFPAEYYTRLHFIDNMVHIPEYVETNNQTLSVIFIGRGAPQKRVYLIGAIAKKMHEMKINIYFSFAGDVENILHPEDYPYCTFYGNVRDRNRLEEIQKESDVLLLTSAYEGLPMSVMEMMAFGKVVVATAVGGIPDYITHEENGFLIKDTTDENKIIEESISILNRLVNDKKLLKEVGEKSRIYAEEHFSGEAFCENYRKVLFG